MHGERIPTLILERLLRLHTRTLEAAYALAAPTPFTTTAAPRSVRGVATFVKSAVLKATVQCELLFESRIAASTRDLLASGGWCLKVARHASLRTMCE